MGINKVILVGNLGKDPELRYSGNQTAICKFPIATTERRRDQDGNWSDHTEWHNVTTFGKTAENCSNYLQKGRQVYIEGKISTSKYEKDGQTRYFTEILANTVQFLGSKGDGESARGGASFDIPSADQVAGGSSASSANDVTFDDDDIPF